MKAASGREYSTDGLDTTDEFTQLIMHQTDLMDTYIGTVLETFDIPKPPTVLVKQLSVMFADQILGYTRSLVRIGNSNQNLMMEEILAHQAEIMEQMGIELNWEEADLDDNTSMFVEPSAR